MHTYIHTYFRQMFSDSRNSGSGILVDDAIVRARRHSLDADKFPMFSDG